MNWCLTSFKFYGVNLWCINNTPPHLAPCTITFLVTNDCGVHKCSCTSSPFIIGGDYSAGDAAWSGVGLMLGRCH